MHPSNGLSHLAYLGQMEGDLLSKSCLRDWYLVGIAPICSNRLLFALIFEFHRYPYLPISHCAQIGRYGVFVRGWYAGLCPSMGACSIMIGQFPSYPPIKPQVVSVGLASYPGRLGGERRLSPPMWPRYKAYH